MIAGGYSAKQPSLDENSLELHAIVDEAALRRQVGDAQRMREQLEVLADANNHPSVTLQVIPFCAELAKETF